MSSWPASSPPTSIAHATCSSSRTELASFSPHHARIAGSCSSSTSGSTSASVAGRRTMRSGTPGLQDLLDGLLLARDRGGGRPPQAQRGEVTLLEDLERVDDPHRRGEDEQPGDGGD